MKAYIFSYGELYMPEGVLKESGDMQNISMIPSYGVFIEHPDGNVLFDTGCALDPSCPDPVADEMGIYNKEDFVVNRLSEIGFTPDDVDYVVLSHMHQDHGGNIHPFNRATFVAGTDEFIKTVNNQESNNSPQLLAKYIDPQRSWKLLGEGEHELLPGIALFNVGAGHSYAMVAMRIELEQEGTILVISDIAYGLEHYTGEYRAGFVKDAEGYNRCIQRVRKIAEESHAQVWFGHDARQFKTLRMSPKYHS